METIDTSLLTPERPRRISRDEYDQMVAMGLFHDERVELLRGTLVAMSPNDPRHASPIRKLDRLLQAALLGRAEILVQAPLVAADDSEPEPDLAVVPLGDYDAAHPRYAHLVVEVAHTSLRKDRLVKAPLYAESGYDEYWLVNVVDSVVEVHRGPIGSSWSSVSRHAREETLHLYAFPDVAIRIADFLR